MELKGKYKFVNDFYATKPFLAGNKVVLNWLKSQQDKLLTPGNKQLNDAIGNEKKLQEILNVFNVNGKSEPIIGNWMLKECSIVAAKLANTWGKFAVSAEKWKSNVFFTPNEVNLFNGSLIKKPQGVECYAITTKEKRSFFKAYQKVDAGAKFTFSVIYPEDLCEKVDGRGASKKFIADPKESKKCVQAVIDKMFLVGLGAYRVRFGQFKNQ